MRARVSAQQSRVVFVATGVLILAAASAQADPEAPPAPAPSHYDLPAVGAPDSQRSWLRTHLSRVRIHKKTGLAYTTRLQRDGSDLELSVRGPGMGRKRLGLSLEVRF